MDDLAAVRGGGDTERRARRDRGRRGARADAGAVGDAGAGRRVGRVGAGRRRIERGGLGEARARGKGVAVDSSGRAHARGARGADAAVSDDDGGGERRYRGDVRGARARALRHHVRLRVREPRDETAREFVLARGVHVRVVAHGESFGRSRERLRRRLARARVLRVIAVRLARHSRLLHDASSRRGVRTTHHRVHRRAGARRDFGVGVRRRRLSSRRRRAGVARSARRER